MTAREPIICFGQQPCGFFPKRFLFAKILTAQQLQSEIGGRIVWFFHDADHDPRETMTLLRHRKTGEEAHLNFDFLNKTQRKYTPLYAKGFAADWKQRIERQLPNYVPASQVEAFARSEGDSVAAFCLSVYRELGLLDGIEIMRSGDPEFRAAADPIEDCFVDVEWEGELVRARRCEDGVLRLHCGGPKWIDLPSVDFDKKAVSPTRDSRLRWMQSVIGCTHYIAGASEMDYLDRSTCPEIEFLPRFKIDRPSDAYVVSE